jgi:RNA polymerase sigma-70 factor, ECF subfamily
MVGGDGDDEALAAFMRVRPRLFGLTQRMLGDAAEAEDVVQDAWIRWQTADRHAVRDAAAFLVTTATRLAINVMQSARVRRETSASPGLPEPVDTTADPRLEAERDQALSAAVLVLLDTLTPTERTAYILREAFDYPYRQIAGALQIEEANARQVVTRARRRVAYGRATCTPRRDATADTFVQWIQSGSSAVIRGTAATAGTRAVEVQR